MKQTNGEFSLKEPMLVSYKIVAQSLWKKFQNVRCEHNPRSMNNKLLQPPNYKDGEDWRAFIVDQLLEPTSTNIPKLKTLY